MSLKIQIVNLYVKIYDETYIFYRHQLCDSILICVSRNSKHLDPKYYYGKTAEEIEEIDNYLKKGM